MAEEFALVVGRLLDQYDEKRAEVVARIRDVKASGTAFFAEFAKLRRSVVRPVFEELANVLDARGHACTILEEESGAQTDGKNTEARIEIRIAPAGLSGSRAASEPSPSLAIVSRHYNRTVEVLSGNLVTLTGDSAGPRGAYQLTQLTPDFVREKLVTLVTDFVCK